MSPSKKHPSQNLSSSNVKKPKIEHSSADEILKSVPLISLPTSGQSLPIVTSTKEDIPEGKSNCLASLSFVCTGVLQLLERDEAQSLIKRYGGKVLTAVSSKTSFVVFGDEAGPKKIQLIKQHRTKVINEDGLFYLIKNLPQNGGDTAAASLALKKSQELEAQIIKDAEESAKELASKTTNGNSAAIADIALWTKKYAPTKLQELCGNKKSWQQLQDWLHHWPQSLKCKFQKGGPDGSFFYRSVLISGPPGLGKTTAAHLIANLEGYDIIELNASDTRNKSLLDQALRQCMTNTSVRGFFAPKSDSNANGSIKSENGTTNPTENKHRNIAIIMDEIDGMSAGDRGGVAQLKLLIKNTKVPIICICNDRYDRKLRVLDGSCFELKAIRPTAQMLRSRIMTICYREKIKIDMTAADTLIESCQSDMRQIINLLFMIKMSQKDLDHDRSKLEGKKAEKNVTMKAFDITHRYLSGEIFRNKHSLNDAIELYFHDPDLVPLMVYDTLLNTTPAKCRKASSPSESKKLSLKSIISALDCICIGEKIDRKIHGPDQQWSLMPYHALYSCVMPSFHMNGSINGQIRFPSFLGNISRSGKINRQLLELQSHMRQRTVITTDETRQIYCPLLYQKTFGTLSREGSEAVPEVIDLLDHYYLSRDNLQYLEDILVDCSNISKSLGPKKIPTAVLSGFTRKYNTLSHPINTAPIDSSKLSVGKALKAEVPDLEEAIEQDNDEQVEDTAAQDSADEDISKNKLIKVVTKGKEKGKASSKSKTTASSRTKRK